MVQVKVDIDQSGVYNMVKTFTSQLNEAEAFALAESERVIKEVIFHQVVARLGRRAGPGWVPAYSNHLSQYMQLFVPIIGESRGGRLTITLDFDNLGDYNDLERSAHHQALIDTGADRFNPNPPKVTLPYANEPLINDGSHNPRRQEFWEQVIMGRDMSFGIGRRKGNREMVAGELGEIPTFRQIAAERVTAWVEVQKAPQWLWLENGFPGEPEINPVDFTRTLNLVIGCVVSRIYEGAIQSLVRIAEDAGENVTIGVGGSFGRIRSVRSGQFVNYRKVLDESVPDYSTCLGSI